MLVLGSFRRSRVQTQVCHYLYLAQSHLEDLKYDLHLIVACTGLQGTWYMLC